MKNIRNFLLGISLLVAFSGFSQDNDAAVKSNIQQYTPSKLIGKGQWDIKWFNNLYTETKANYGTNIDVPRASYFTSSIEGYTGVGENKRWNIGLILKIRSNAINGSEALDVLKFGNKDGVSRAGVTAFAPSVKFVPFQAVGNFSIQSSLYIPLVGNETENGVFLDQKGFIWQNRFFYDYTFPGNKWQLFTELNTELNFGKKRINDANGNSIEGSFANNSLSLTPGVFISYFPTGKSTLLALVQHSQRLDLGNNFTQNYTAIGGGAKYQLTNALNIELLYTSFVRGSNTGLGETFNLGLRAIF